MADYSLEDISNMFEGSQQYTGSLLDLKKSEISSAKSRAKAQNKSQEKIAKGAQSTQRGIAALEAQAAADRQAADIQAKYGLADKEQAAAMARLEKDLSVRREDIANNLLMSRERIGFDREKLAAEVQIEREKLSLARDEMEKIGIPKMQADRWYQQQQVSLAQSAQKIEREKVGIQRGQLGLDAFTKAMELANSPAKYFQFGQFAEGLNSNAQAGEWLSEMANQYQKSGFGPSTDIAAQGAQTTPTAAMASMLAFLGAKAPQEAVGLTPQQQARYQQLVERQAQLQAAGMTMEAADGPAAAAELAAYADAAGRLLQRQMAGNGAAPAPGAAPGAGTGNPAMDAYLARQQQELQGVSQIAKAGGSSLAPGTLEKMAAGDPDSLAKFQSGLSALRYSVPDWMRSYQGAGIYNAAPEQY